MNLGAVISALVNQPQDNKVEFDFCGCYPNLRYFSYRGFYEQMAMGFCFPPRDAFDVGMRRDENKYADSLPKEPPTVKEFLIFLRESIGKRITGYKGGEYTIAPSTILRVAPSSSQSTNLFISKVTEYYGYTILHTKYADGYELFEDA